MDIKKLIPHRDPFLWVTDIVDHREGFITTTAHFPEDLELFKGHYPDHPLVPGVILCEAVFQSGAAMISLQMKESGDALQGVPVLTRILGAKFKQEVRPSDTVTIDVHHTESMGTAWYMKGKVRLENKLAVSVEFAVMITGAN